MKPLIAIWAAFLIATGCEGVKASPGCRPGEFYRPSKRECVSKAENAILWKSRRPPVPARKVSAASADHIASRKPDDVPSPIPIVEPKADRSLNPLPQWKTFR
jgi:hypothetical protein